MAVGVLVALVYIGLIAIAIYLIAELINLFRDHFR